MSKTVWFLIMFFGFIFIAGAASGTLIYILNPDGDSDVNFTPIGEANNYLCVDDGLNGDNHATYNVYLGSVNVIMHDYFTMVDVLPNGTIDYVLVRVLANRTSSQYSTLFYTLTRINGVNYTDYVTSMDQTYHYYNTQYNTNPDTGVAWTWDDINNLEIGYYMHWYSTAHVHASHVILQVYYDLLPPDEPTISNIVGAGDNDFRVSFSKGTRANNTVVVRKENSYPSSVTDGTVMYNDTGTQFDINTTDTSYYYRMWSYYEETYGSSNYSCVYSTNYTDIPLGNLTLYCFDENTSTGLTFDVLITNETSGYTETGLTGPHNISISSIPQGDQVSIIFSSTNYRSRTYYLSIVDGGWYNISAYLPETNGSNLYTVSVVGTQGEYTSHVVEDATVQFRRLISGSFENVSTMITDANGQVNVYLIPNVQYKAVISLEGYITEYADWTPPEILYVGDNEYTFRIVPEDAITEDYVHFWDAITFTATKLYNGTIYINYVDSNSSTTDTQFYIFEYDNGTMYLNDTTQYTGNNSLGFYVGNINWNRSHLVYLYFNNTANFDHSSPVVLTVYPLFINGTTDLDQRIKDMLGPFNVNNIEIPWSNILAIILPVIILSMLGPYNTGVGIIGAGVTLGFMEVLFITLFSNSFNILLAALAPCIVAIGILYIMTKGQGSDYL